MRVGLRGRSVVLGVPLIAIFQIIDVSFLCRPGLLNSLNVIHGIQWYVIQFIQHHTADGSTIDLYGNDRASDVL